MKIFNYETVELEDAGAGTAGVKVRWVIGEKTGAPNFAMRIFDFEPGGHTPRHTHDWEHEVFVLQGGGTALTPEGDKPIKAGDAVFIPGGEIHQFRNTGDALMRVMCLIPIVKTEGKKEGC
jgi:quercetin dioxygenase-like cupin family protein